MNANRISLSYWQDYVGDLEASPVMIPVVTNKVVRLDTISNLYRWVPVDVGFLLVVID